jgi:hypothetical protein
MSLAQTLESVLSKDIILSLKDTFRNTLKWKMSDLQSLILDKIDKNKHEYLLNAEHVLDLKQSIP